jgi:serine acetyltransferase
MVTFKQTIDHLKADFHRRQTLEGNPAGPLGLLSVLLKRGMIAVILYRLSRYCVLNRLKVLARLLAVVEYFYTKNEISPIADLGPGLVLADSGAIGITQVTVAGKNCTFLGCNSITLGAMEDFDVNRDRIVLGDHCVIGIRARIMRPVHIANGTQVKSNSVVLLPVEKVGSTVFGVPAKRRSIDNYEDIVRWNPLRSGFI